MRGTSSSSSSSGGIGFVGLLTVVFITLKLTDAIDWSWWWVLSPVLIMWSSFIVIFPALVGMVFHEEIREWIDRRRK